MQALLITVDQIITSMPFFAIVFLLAYLGKAFFDRTTPYIIGEELTVRDNAAFGIAFAGYIVGLGIALSGTVAATGFGDLAGESLTVLVYGTLTVILMRVSIYLNDKAILYKFQVDKEIVVDRNRGTGFVVAGSSIATGFMLRGVLSGHSDTFILGLRDVLIYFVVGQSILIAGGLLFTRFTAYDVHEEIEHDDNTAAGISFGGFLTALGYIAGIALTGATSRVAEETITAFVMALFGIVVLLVARIIADRLLLPASRLSKEVAEDQNTAAGALAAASFLLVALLFAGAVHPGQAELAEVPLPVAEEVGE